MLIAHFIFCLVCRMSSQWEGSKEQALYNASSEGDLAMVILPYWLVTSACYRVHHLLLCGEGAGPDPKRCGTEPCASGGESGVVEIRVFGGVNACTCVCDGSSLLCVIVFHNVICVCFTVCQIISMGGLL